jgi:hypothetical protein
MARTPKIHDPRLRALVQKERGKRAKPTSPARKRSASKQQAENALVNAAWRHSHETRGHLMGLIKRVEHLEHRVGAHARSDERKFERLEKPRKRKSKIRRKKVTRRTARKLRVPSLPANHPFNRPRKKTTRKRKTSRKTTRKVARKTPTRRPRKRARKR